MMRSFVVAATLLFFPISVECRSEDWPQFRGPTGQGLSAAKHVPVRWSATENIAWKATIPGKGWSSPILIDGKVYLTTAVPGEGSPDSPLSLRALCVDSKSG